VGCAHLEGTPSVAFRVRLTTYTIAN
jgi:hypothetical protein